MQCDVKWNLIRSKLDSFQIQSDHASLRTEVGFSPTNE
jgi:hypothetical protein